MLGIMGIRLKNLYEPQNDITSDSWNSDPSRFRTLYGRKKIADDPSFRFSF